SLLGRRLQDSTGGLGICQLWDFSRRRCEPCGLSTQCRVEARRSRIKAEPCLEKSFREFRQTIAAYLPAALCSFSLGMKPGRPVSTTLLKRYRVVMPLIASIALSDKGERSRLSRMCSALVEVVRTAVPRCSAHAIQT